LIAGDLLPPGGVYPSKDRPSNQIERERERDERDQGKRQTKIFKQTGNDFHYGMAMSEVLQIGTGYAILCLHTRPKPGLRLIFSNVTIYYNEILHNS